MKTINHVAAFSLNVFDFLFYAFGIERVSFFFSTRKAVRKKRKGIQCSKKMMERDGLEGADHAR
jgi:hypothetical protein